MARRKTIAGNWKMHLDRERARGLARDVRRGVEQTGGDVDVALVPPLGYLEAVARELEGSPVRLGAQTVSEHAEGAYTGEVSVGMLADLGCSFALVGHSERRQLFGEDDARVRAKLRALLDGGLEAVLCLGETLEEREAKHTEAVVRRQLSAALEGVTATELRRITLAYEPVWAIGTGRTASAEQASEVHLYLRGLLAGLYDGAAAEAVRIQYGGSVKANNARELLHAPGVDGALVGGASLAADSFLAIVAAGQS
jgi:triosephosphate isomerase (TIM)